MGRSQHADVDLELPVAADRAKALLLEHPEQLGLQGRREIAELVQEDRPAFGFSSPRRAVRASVKAPRSWPKSSLSRSASGIAAQLKAMKGPAARLLRSCSARATSSLPVPLSPRMSTDACECPTRSISS